MTSSFILLSLYWRGLAQSPEAFLKLRHRPLDEFLKTENIFREMGWVEFIYNHPHWFERTQKEWDWLQDHHGRVVYLGDSHYPKNFACMEQPPIGMTYFGNECWVQKPGVAVVGSRQPHHLTIEWLNMELSLALQTTDYYTISGGARGVDQAVHLVSLRQNTATVSFMPSGLSCLYPKSFQYWAHEITEQGGAIVSQFSPFAPMYKSHFHARNRLIAGLCDFLIVAEARCRSGSLLTAKLALEMHKNIGVVPCSPMLTTGRGGLDLIFDGAQMLRDHLDVTTWVKPGITFDS